MSDVNLYLLSVFVVGFFFGFLAMGIICVVLTT